MLKKNYMEIYMENHQKNKYRYERKYILSPINLPGFLYELNSKDYIEIYTERTINNLYLDSCDLSSVQDNINGLSNRKKYRIRWYGPSFSKSKKQFEIKKKSEFLNSKSITLLGDYKVDGLKDIERFFFEITESLEQNNVYINNSLKHLFPSLFNSYERRYFLSKDQKIRITIDSFLNFYSPITTNKFEENNLIVEAKYSKDTIRIDSFKHLNLCKYSKYVKGVLSTSTYMPVY